MNILLVTEFFPTGKDLRFSGGVEARTYYIAKGLASINHKVYVISSWQKGTPKKEKISNFTVIRVSPRRNYTASIGHIFSRLQFIFNAIKLGKSLDIDIVDGGNYIAHFISKSIASYKKIPAVAWYPDVWLNEWVKFSGIVGIFGEILERLNLLRGFDGYIAISATTAQKLKKYTSKKIYKVYCGIQKNEFSKQQRKFAQPTIICVSRLVHYKNLKTLLFAFADLTSKISRIRLIIVGSGPQLAELKHTAKNLNFERKVKFLSNLPRNNLLKLYQSSHIFSLPSLVEGFGIATIEAASAGLPYVNSNIPTHKEITHNGKGGYLVDDSNPVAYSNRLQSLIENERLYKRKSLEAKGLAEYYDWSKIVEQTEKIYLSLLNQ